MADDQSHDVTRATFAARVLERSKEVPVLVDFWAAWCGPCRSVAPVLARLADEYRGRLELAKVDTDTESELAMQYGIRSLPTMLLFKDGEAVDQILGAHPESNLRQFIEGHLPGPVDQAVAAALEQHRQGGTREAIETLEALNRDNPDDHRLRLALAELLLETGRVTDAQACLEGIGISSQFDQQVKILRARIGFAETADSAPALETLRGQLESEPDNNEARFKLSALLVERGDYEAAMDQLLELVRRERHSGDDSGRQGLINVFTILGSDARVQQYRAKLAQVLN